MILLVMAAGLGSRFGGDKQITPVGPNGEWLIDYCIYDAILAGVSKVVFVIRESYYDVFKKEIESRISNKVEICYVFQELDNIPSGFEVPKGRVKPWGTGQAILCARDVLDDNFMIVNADDFYGRDAFLTLGKYLKSATSSEYAMVGYVLENTLSANGSVSRGVCKVDNNSYLSSIEECKNIIRGSDGKIYALGVTGDGNDRELSSDSIVSLNLFGFTPTIIGYLEKYFREFLADGVNIETREFYIPEVVRKLVDNNNATVKVLKTTSVSGGMTYREDLEELRGYIMKLISDGVYPNDLWRSL